MREALFDILGPAVRDSVFLDLFAGSGAVGIEALSRGAARVVLIESARPALAVITKNLGSLPPDDRLVVVNGSWPRALDHAIVAASAPFTIVFVDPPWTGAPLPAILESLSGAGFLSEGARVIVEHEARTGVPEHGGRFARVRLARYGRAGLAFYECEPAP